MKKFRGILILITIVGFILSGFFVALRVILEQRNTVVEIVADYEDFSEIASKTNSPIKEVSNKLISSGVTSIAISEESLEGMEENGEILLYQGVDLKYINVKFNNEYMNLALNAKKYIEENSLDYKNISLVFGNNIETFNFLDNSFRNRFKDLYISFTGENNFCILIKKNLGQVKNVGLGLTDKDFEFAKTLGFNNIIPSIENHEGITELEVDNLYEQLKKYKVRTIIFAGVNVFGQDFQDEDETILKYIGEKFSQSGSEIITAIIEKPAETDLETVQRGIKNLAKYSGYVNTKVFSTDNSQLQKLTYNGLAEQWGRAISQRNVRVIYVRPLDKAEKTDIENFENTLLAIREIKDRINHMGMKLGNAKGLGKSFSSPLIYLGISLGIVSSGFLLLLFIFNEDKLKKFIKVIIVLFILIVLGVILIYLVPYSYNSFGDLINKLMALASSIIFASFSGLYFIVKAKDYYNEGNKNIRDIILKSVFMLLVSVIIAGIGGIFIGGILSDSKYILKLDTFRGVKISFLLPLIIWGFIYIIKWGIYCDDAGNPLPLLTQCKKFLEEKVTVKYVAIFGVIGILLLLIVARSGNTMTSTASSFELMFRNFLEKYLVARPRTKELIAFPLLMLIPYFAFNKNKEFCFFMMGAGMIGIENVINSFCHIRMPIMVTTLSTIYSLIFGIIIGSIGIIVIEKVKKVFLNKLGSKDI